MQESSQQCDAALHRGLPPGSRAGPAAVGALIAAIGIAVTSREKRGRAKTGLILNGIVVVVAVIRLSMFGGLL